MSANDIKLQILPAHLAPTLLIEGESRPVRRTRIFDGHGREFDGLEDVTSTEDPRQPFSVLVTITMRLRSDEIAIIDSPPDVAPIAPSIPVLTDWDCEAGSLEAGIDTGRLMRWAYALAAERAGVQIKDTQQELADDAKQIGLEY